MSSKTVKQGDHNEKTVRQFAQKAAQIIVQSRLGPSKHHESTTIAKSNHDCFGMYLVDLPEVAKDTKETLSRGFVGKTLTVDTYLHFNDGEDVKLESWSLQCIVTGCDYDNSAYELFYRAGIMLKSLVCVTRALPAHKIAKNLDPDTCEMMYKIREGEGNIEDLGDTFQTFNFKYYQCGPYAVIVTVAYRISVVKTWKRRDSDCKKGSKMNAVTARTQSNVNFERHMKTPAFVDDTAMSEISEQEYYRDLKWLYKFCEERPRIETEMEVAKEAEVEINDANELGEIHDSVKKKTEKQGGDKNDKFARQLNCAFVTQTPLSELAQFYRIFDQAPPLELFDTSSSRYDDVSEQLKEFENTVKIYDELIDDL